MIGVRDLTQPAAEPVTLVQAKSHLRVDFSDDDDLIGTYISAARTLAEKMTRRAFFNRDVQLTLDHFPIAWSETLNPSERHPALDWFNRFAIRLPKPSCVEVKSIKYQDGLGTQITLDPSSYVVDANSEPARIVPVTTMAWPYPAIYTPGSIAAVYTAGTYGDGVEVNNTPANVVAAILLLLGHLYENRSATAEKTLATIPLAVESLLASEVHHTFGY
jgi:uncharacterized phiE125 gp8 family phage protein